MKKNLQKTLGICIQKLRDKLGFNKKNVVLSNRPESLEVASD